MVRLKFLHLAENQIHDISPLRSLVGLEWLSIAANYIESLDSLAELPVLT